MSMTAEGITTGETSTPTTRRRRSRRSDSATAGTGRGRPPRLSGDDLVAQLTAMVDQLIDENRALKRALARAERSAGGGDGLGQATRALSGLQRRVSRALADAPGAGGRRRSVPEAAAAPRPRRRVTDPEVLERRRQALVKARAARAAKREANA